MRGVPHFLLDFFYCEERMTGWEVWQIFATDSYSKACQKEKGKNLPPSLFNKHKGIGYFEVPAGARGQRRALRNPKAVVFPWKEAGAAGFPPLFAETLWFRR
jgi:hypothetical protein